LIPTKEPRTPEQAPAQNLPEVGTVSVDEIQQVLRQYTTVAVVGLSRNPEKTSYEVAEYLQAHGYHIIPINPNANIILGQEAYRSLTDLPEELQKTVEIVDIFRPSKDVPLIVEQAIRLRRRHGRPHTVWMQLGVINEAAAEKAQKAGFAVVMDKCMRKEHIRLSEQEKDPELEKIKAKKMKEMKDSLEAGKRISTPLKVTDDSFEEIVGKYPLIVIDCWAAWCGPCRMLAPVIDELAKEHAGQLVFGKLDVDANPHIATRFNVMSVPTMLIMKNGEEVDRIVGALPKPTIQQKIREYI
jgi:thioredoxin 1